MYYHATYRHLLPSIQEHGLGYLVVERNFPTDHKRGVYLANDPMLAIGFLLEKFMSRFGVDVWGQPLPPDIIDSLPKEAPSELDKLSPKDVVESFVVLATERIDESLLIPDPNIQGHYGSFWFYSGVITFADISILD